MKRTVRIVGVVALVLAMWAGEASAQVPVIKQINSHDDPVSLGEPLSHWLAIIRSRDPEQAELAFDAIVELGPAARKAVPELTRIVAEPFTPIRVGRDDRREVLSKLLDIQLRAGAVDSLAAIGEDAAAAAPAVIQWSLTIRVLPSDVRTPEDAFYIELVGMDVLERMRGAGAMARFGVRAAGAVQELVESRDNEKVKFATAILSEGSLPIATSLLASESCRDRVLGLTLLADMWSVVAVEHLKALKDIVACPADESRDGTAVGSGTARSRKTQLPLH